LSELAPFLGVTVSPHAQVVVRTVSAQTATTRHGLLIRAVVDGRSGAVPMVMFLGVARRHHDGTASLPEGCAKTQNNTHVLDHEAGRRQATTFYKGRD
jgi:hypothetical protein